MSEVKQPSPGLEVVPAYECTPLTVEPVLLEAIRRSASELRNQESFIQIFGSYAVAGRGRHFDLPNNRFVSLMSVRETCRRVNTLPTTDIGPGDVIVTSGINEPNSNQSVAWIAQPQGLAVMSGKDYMLADKNIFGFMLQDTLERMSLHASNEQSGLGFRLFKRLLSD